MIAVEVHRLTFFADPAERTDRCPRCWGPIRPENRASCHEGDCRHFRKTTARTGEER